MSPIVSLGVNAARPLRLAEMQPFARGGKRHCYVHPDDPDLCIKVAANPRDPRCHREQRMDLEDSDLLKRRFSDAVFDRIPRIAGVVGTDLGPGIAMQLYRDPDRRISRCLLALIEERRGVSPSLNRAIDELKGWLRAQRLLTRDTSGRNCVAVHLGEDEWQLKIVEGWCARRHRWLASLHPIIADRLIGRELRKFDRRLAERLGEPAHGVV